ncbi:hypothetical protein ACLKA7_015318 [Drosophila subpalustris]
MPVSRFRTCELRLATLCYNTLLRRWRRLYTFACSNSNRSQAGNSNSQKTPFTQPYEEQQQEVGEEQERMEQEQAGGKLVYTLRKHAMSLCRRKERRRLELRFFDRRLRFGCARSNNNNNKNNNNNNNNDELQSGG